MSYTPIKAYHTAVLGCRDWLRVKATGWFVIRIVMLRMASVSTLVGCEDRVSRVERVVSVGVTDGSSLVLAVLRVRILLFVVRVFLVVLRTVGLFHRRYK